MFPLTETAGSGCRLHGELAALVVRESATAVQGELLACYALIERLGRCSPQQSIFFCGMHPLLIQECQHPELTILLHCKALKVDVPFRAVALQTGPLLLGENSLLWAGRGVVYYGSARLEEDSPHWGRAQALGRRLSQMLHVTTWSGAGPGMMEAATLGTQRTCLPAHARQL